MVKFSIRQTTGINSKTRLYIADHKDVPGQLGTVVKLALGILFLLSYMVSTK